MTRLLLSISLAVLICCNVSARQAESLQSAANQAATNQLIDVLVNDMDELIPGQYAPDSESAIRLREIAKAYLARNEQKVGQLLGELTTSQPEVPPRDLLLAGLAYATNNPNNGRVLLERGAVKDGSHPGFPLAFARLALLQNRYYDSITLAEKAREANQASRFPPAVKRFYEVESVALLTVIEMRRNEFKAAENYAQQWAELAPKDDKMFLAAAELKFKQGKTEPASNLLDQRSVGKKIEFPSAVILGKWFQAGGNSDEHAKWITKGFRENPESKLAQIEYAVVLLRTELFDEALEVVKKYEAAHGVTPDSELVRGRIAFSREDYQTAGKLFSKLFQLQPNNFEHAYLNTLAMLENPDQEVKRQAVPLAQRAFQLFPNNQSATALLGWALVNTDNVEQGSQIIKRAQAMGGMLPDTAYFLAHVMQLEDRKPQAIRILDQVVGAPGIFLFRSRAKSMLQDLMMKNSLPSPGGDN